MRVPRQEGRNHIQSRLVRSPCHIRLFPHQDCRLIPRLRRRLRVLANNGLLPHRSLQLQQNFQRAHNPRQPSHSHQLSMDTRQLIFLRTYHVLPSVQESITLRQEHTQEHTQELTSLPPQTVYLDPQVLLILHLCRMLPIIPLRPRYPTSLQSRLQPRATL